jgi:hypothetical protein
MPHASLRLRAPWWLPTPNGSHALVALAIVVGVLAAAESALFPHLDRPLVACLAALSLCLLALRRPRHAIVAVMVFLPFLGMLRRVLIPVAGWSSTDALLMIAPVLSILLAVRLFIRGRPFGGDLLSNLVMALLALTIVQTVNPMGGGGLLVGVTGFLFLGAPLLWFFIGRELIDRRLVAVLLPVLIIVTLIIAFYGLRQTSVGLLSWDAQWLEVSGYAALRVGNTVRAFGTLASSSEYAAFLAAGLVLSAIWVMHGRLLPLIALPPLAIALFLDSSRGIVVVGFAAVLIVAGLRTGSGRLTVAVIALGVGGVFAANHSLGSSLNTSAQRSGNSLIAHQVGGLTDPLNPDQSTLLLHLQIAGTGMVASFSHPLGLGTAATSLAATHRTLADALNTSGDASTEVDVSNAFVSLGLAGGVIYLAIIVVTFRRVGQLCLRTRDRAALAVMGLLVISLGQWLNGGYYALSPLLWLLIGWANRAWLEQRAAAVPVPALAPSGR